MMMVPCSFWPLAEHASFGQNCFDASIGSVDVCISYSMPMDACFFKPSFPFHRIVGFYHNELPPVVSYNSSSTLSREYPHLSALDNRADYAQVLRAYQDPMFHT